MLFANGTLIASELAFNTTYVVDFTQSTIVRNVFTVTQKFDKSIVVIFDLVTDVSVVLNLTVGELVESYS